MEGGKSFPPWKISSLVYFTLITTDKKCNDSVHTPPSQPTLNAIRASAAGHEKNRLVLDRSAGNRVAITKRC